MEFMSVKEAAAKWDVSERSVHKYCENGRIPGIRKFGRSWAIPADAVKPADVRKRLQQEKTRNIQKAEHSWEGKRVGGIITAAGKYGKDGGVSPFLQIGSTSLIRRIVLIFQQARISPIVVVTGYQSLEVERHLADYGVVFLNNEEYESSDKFASTRLGLEFLYHKCDKIFLASLKIPMYMPDTLREMICYDKGIIIPRFEGHSGHPLLLDASVVPLILEYQGSDGMRGALNACGCVKEYLQVEDEGVLLNAENIARLEESLVGHNEELLHPFVRLSLEKDRVFFDSRAKLLLFLIQEFHSVQGACKQMAISRGKAWDMIGRMEEELGFVVVKRQQGGSRERQAKLTEKGEEFLRFFNDYEETVKTFAVQQFKERYEEFKKM